jgi:RNase P subunit RPR2
VLRIGVRAARAPLKGEWFVTLTCPNCGNDRNFQVKTLQMHVVHLEDGRVEVSEESRPAVLEVLCDECESALKFEEFEDTLRKEVLLTIGAR